MARVGALRSTDGEPTAPTITDQNDRTLSPRKVRECLISEPLLAILYRNGALIGPGFLDDLVEPPISMSGRRQASYEFDFFPWGFFTTFKKRSSLGDVRLLATGGDILIVHMPDTASKKSGKHYEAFKSLLQNDDIAHLRSSLIISRQRLETSRRVTEKTAAKVNTLHEELFQKRNRA